MQDEVEVHPHIPADTDTDTKDGDTMANEKITAAYEQVLMPPPLSPPTAEVPFEAEIYQDLSTPANDAEPGSELQLEEIHPFLGYVTLELPPRPRRPPKSRPWPSSASYGRLSECV